MAPSDPGGPPGVSARERKRADRDRWMRSRLDTLSQAKQRSKREASGKESGPRQSRIGTVTPSLAELNMRSQVMRPLRKNIARAPNPWHANGVDALRFAWDRKECPTTSRNAGEHAEEC